MRVLWFTHIPISFNSNLTSYKGGNWITTLKDAISSINGIELGICFNSTTKTEWKVLDNDIMYYNLVTNPGILQKMYGKVTHQLSDEKLEKYLEVIEDFKPDIIQIFGTESAFGRIAPYTNIPIIIHVQGLINPCLTSWFPQGINLNDIFRSTSIKSIFLGNGFYHRYFYFKKQAKREIEIIKNNKHFFTRTDWDKDLIRLINPKAIIFNCEEVIRKEFAENEWQYPAVNNKHVFVSIINGEIYKGWDNILRIASLVRKLTDIQFEWRIIGIKDGNKEKKLFENKYKTLFTSNHVRFLGKKEAKEIITELKNANLFLHVSHIDNSPNTVCEAMLLGMTVLCTNVGGCGSLIRNNVNGLLLSDNDPFIWVAKIKEILCGDQKRVITLGKNARLTALKRNNQKSIVADILDTYEKITGKSLSNLQIDKVNK